MPKVPTMKVPSDDGSATTETVYMFQNPLQPFRTLDVCTEYRDRKSTPRLTTDANLYADHGRRLWQHCAKRRHEAMSPELTSALKPAVSFPTLEDHAKKKLGPEAEAALRPTLEKFALAALATESSSSSTTTTQAGNNASAPAQEEPTALIVAPRKASLLERSLAVEAASPAKKTRCNAEDQEPVSSLQRKQSSMSLGSGLSEAGETAELGDEAMQDVRRLQTSKEKFMALKANMPLTKIMAGLKLGRQEYSCKCYLTNSKLDQGDVRLLRQHLKLALILSFAL